MSNFNKTYIKIPIKKNLIQNFNSKNKNISTKNIIVIYLEK